MAILESGEMYVETIYILSLESDKVRAKDICDFLGFTRPSVSRAIFSLKEKGLVRKDTNGNIKLTEGGIILAKHIHGRVGLLKDLLTELGVDEELAAQDASRIVRFISDETFDKIKDHVNGNKR
ncbi:MAG: metal-dependent transcriptional regulator [Saccharofermentans sp.]|nr:metal-dependent transcriptional regulator [Saccharofermentans sp.]